MRSFTVLQFSCNGEEDIRLFPYRASQVRTVTQALQPS
jgi:hypothetical protein